MRGRNQETQACLYKWKMLATTYQSFFWIFATAWDYAVAMHVIGPLLIKYARKNDSGGSFKFLFLCGNSTDGYDDSLQENG
ncbi:hypothetical protein I3843_06G053800 [Carya illinoinensis]|nr:hypothetical protein I3843_06G053800 [Carya illinoinensis]